MDLVFALDSEGRTRSSIAGARSHYVELDTSRPFSAIGIHFKPGGGSPFFGVPSGELRDQSVTLDLLWGSGATTITDRLWEAGTPEQQFEILGDALLERGRNRMAIHPAVQYAVDLIDRSRGARPVKAVVERLSPSAYLRQHSSRTHVVAST